MNEITRSIRVPHGAGHIVFEIYEEAGKICCGIVRLSGRLDLPPKAWVTAMRMHLSKIEELAEESGCEEIRIAGRSWQKVFPDYQPYDGPQNGIRKEL